MGPVRRKLDRLQKAMSELEGAGDRYKRHAEYTEMQKENCWYTSSVSYLGVGSLTKTNFETPKGTLFEMVLLPSGRYERGSFRSSVASALEMPPYDVDLTNGFWMFNNSCNTGTIFRYHVFQS